MWHLGLGTPHRNRLILNIYINTFKCSLKQYSLLHNRMPQSLHPNFVLGARRRRCLSTKLLLESSCNGFITRLVLTSLHSFCMHTTQYLASLPSFCMLPCSQTGDILIKSARPHGLIPDFGPLDSVRRSECSKRSVMRSCRNAL